MMRFTQNLLLGSWLDDYLISLDYYLISLDYYLTCPDSLNSPYIYLISIHDDYILFSYGGFNMSYHSYSIYRTFIFIIPHSGFAFTYVGLGGSDPLSKSFITSCVTISYSTAICSNSIRRLLYCTTILLKGGDLIIVAKSAPFTIYTVITDFVTGRFESLTGCGQFYYPFLRTNRKEVLHP